VERVSDSVARSILELASGEELIVLGAHADPSGSPLLIRSEIAYTLRRLPGTVVLVRTTGSVMGRSARGAGRPRSAGTIDMP
jgi:CTP:molybdopterin cytidylyltransferase MocA